MTIAAGFRFNGGVILCADTQEVIAHSKTSVPKLRLEPTMMIARDSPDDLMIAMAGAGNGPFIDKLIERAWEGASSATSLTEACLNVETSIKETHEEYGRIFQAGYLPEAELIYGVKMHGDSKLFSSQGPIVNEKRSYGSVGAGYYMADFLASRMHQRYIPSSNAIMLAAYVLFQCKEHVVGCGGESHIVALNETGDSRFVDPWRVDFATDQLRGYDGLISRLLLSAPDYSFSDAQFKEELKGVSIMIESMRDAGRRTSDAREQYLADIKESQENLRKAFEKHEQAERERKTKRAESRNSETSP